MIKPTAMKKIKLAIPCKKRTFIESVFNLESFHDWQTRATNKFGLPTYQVCLKCGKARERNSMGKTPAFSECKRIKEFDDQFDEKGNLIY